VARDQIPARMPTVECRLVADIPEAVVGVLAAPVAGAVPVIAHRIPPGPAAELGRGT
jgi:hypothetical protein